MCSSVDAGEDKLREIKKIRREEPKSFKRKDIEIQYKLSVKLKDTLDEVNHTLRPKQLTKVPQCSHSRAKAYLILLADKSDSGLKTLEQYTLHELADNEKNGKKIRRAEERAEKALKSTTSKSPFMKTSSLLSPSSSHLSS